MEKKSQLYVLVKVKTLASYVFTVTEKSPKKFRFTLVNRLQNYTLDIIECIIKSNASRDVAYRLGEQQKAKALLNLFDAFAEIAMQEGCLLMKQYEMMSKMVAETLDYLHKWQMATSKKVLAESESDSV